jgi:hypothetical protein
MQLSDFSHRQQVSPPFVDRRVDSWNPFVLVEKSSAG